MPSVVLLRGVNVDGGNLCRPAELAKVKISPSFAASEKMIAKGRDT